MSPNSRRSVVRRPFLACCLLLGLLLAGFVGFASLTRKVGAVFVAPGFSKANKAFTSAPGTELATKARLREGYSRLPLSFEANQGQTDSSVKFLSRGGGYNLFLTPTEAVLRVGIAEHRSRDERNEGIVARSAKPRNLKSTVLRVKFVGANSAAQVAGVDQLPGKSNYFIGNNPAKWRTNVPNYAKVKYENIYRGVDLVMYGNQRQLEYDFVVAPGADPSFIKLAFAGARQMRLDADGDLVLSARGGELRQHAPVIYQEKNGSRQIIDGHYVVKGKKRVGFEIAKYDASLPLIIDPSLVYSTYVGGSSPMSGNDAAIGIAIDSFGNAYITGQTGSTNFPVTAGAYDTTPDTGTGSSDAFVTKLNPSGTALVYSTYLGGVSPFGNSANETGYGIAVDALGNAYVAGNTEASNFPTTPGAVQASPPAALDKGFITKLDPTGSALVYSSYIGGQSYNFGFAVAIDTNGSAYVAGTTGATDFPVTPGAFQTSIGSTSNADVFVVKLNPAGSAYDYSTYLGGTNSEDGLGIAVDSGGRAYVTGTTLSTDFPVTPSAFQTTYQSTGSFSFTQGDVFLTVLDAAGASTPYSTYLGGVSEDQGRSVAVDPSGAAYVTGFTLSSNFPTTPGSFQSITNFTTDVFVAKLNPSASGAASLVYSTYLGGSGFDRGDGVALDAAGNVYVTGQTISTDFPITPCAAQTTSGGAGDAFLTKLNLSLPGPAALI